MALKGISANTGHYALHTLRRGAPFSGVTPAERTAVTKGLRETYRFRDEQTKILLGMRLKGKALEWLHSKPEHVSMPVPLLLSELRGMFSYHSSVLTMRKRFEERTWKQGETFREYVHDKVIMANKVTERLSQSATRNTGSARLVFLK